MRKDSPNMTPSIITKRCSGVGVVLACFVVVVVAAGCGTATKTSATSRSDPLQVCFDNWNAASNAAIRASLPASPVLADVQSLPTGSCSVGVYARQGGVLASWGFTGQSGIYSPVESGMPTSGNATLTNREAASVSASGLIAKASPSNLAVLSAPGPVSGQAAACMLSWNGSKNPSGQQIAAAVASQGERAVVGLDTSSSACLVVLGNTMFQTATVWQWSQGSQQQSLGDFFPQNSGQGVPFSQLDPSLTNWNASVHTDGCISPGANVAAACPSYASPASSAATPMTTTVAPAQTPPPPATPTSQPTRTISGHSFSISVPADWVTAASEVVHGDLAKDGFWDTTVTAPDDPDVLIRIDTSPSRSATAPDAAAHVVAGYFEHQPGYHLLGFRPWHIGSIPAFRWDFTDTEHSVHMRKADLFIQDVAGGTGLALIVQTPASAFAQYQQTFKQSIETLALR